MEGKGMPWRARETPSSEPYTLHRINGNVDSIERRVLLLHACAADAQNVEWLVAARKKIRSSALLRLSTVHLPCPSGVCPEMGHAGFDTLVAAYMVRWRSISSLELETRIGFATISPREVSDDDARVMVTRVVHGLPVWATTVS